MDPLAILQSRIEQLEAKLGVAPGAPLEGNQGDSVTANLVNTAQAIHNATADHEKLNEAMQRATELDNYTDPNFAEKLQQNDMNMHEVVAGEPVLRHHCHCMHRCKQAAPVMESEPILQAPQLQHTVDDIQAAASEVKLEADRVSQGVQELAENWGAAAANAAEQIADVAQKVEQVEQKLFPMRRNGLD